MKILDNIYISGTGNGDVLLVQTSTSSSNFTINSWTNSNQGLFKIKNNPTYSLSNFYVRGTSSLSLSDTESFLYLDYSTNIMNISNDGIFSLNGTIQFRDINFLTQSYATNSNMRGNVNGFILHNGKLINSPWFISNQFSSNGSFFWMEPGYSRTWQTYSPLGDVKKLTFTAAGFTAGSLISFQLDAGLTYSALTYSDIFNISVNSDNRYIYPRITKSFSSNRIFLNVDTFADNVNNLELTVLGRNINFTNFTALPSIAKILSMYAVNYTGTTYSLTIENNYLSRTTFTLSGGEVKQILRLPTTDSTWNDYALYTNNNNIATFYANFTSTTTDITSNTKGVAFNGTLYSKNQSTAVAVNATASWGGGVRSFGIDTNQVFAVGNKDLDTINNYNVARVFIVNTTPVTQSVLYSHRFNNPVNATFSLTLSPNSYKFVALSLDVNPFVFYYIKNVSTIGSTFSLKAYYTRGNYSQFISVLNWPVPFNVDAGPSGSTVQTDTSQTTVKVFEVNSAFQTFGSPGSGAGAQRAMDGTQSSFILHLHNGGTAGTFTASFPLPLVITYSIA